MTGLIEIRGSIRMDFHECIVESSAIMCAGVVNASAAGVEGNPMAGPVTAKPPPKTKKKAL